MKTECKECGSKDIVNNIQISQAVEAGFTGLQYKAALFLSGTETLLADLCNQCGTIVRFHVENPNKKWQTKK